VSEGAVKKEEKPRKFQAIRGTRDLLPPETALWNRVEQTAHEVFATFGFGEIRLPIFEQTELFARSVGSRTDVVGKEMYTFDPARELFTVDEIPDDVPVQERTESTGEFVFRIRDAFLKGDIPQIEGNKRAIEALLAKFTELAAISQQLPRGFFQGGSPVFEEYRNLDAECHAIAQGIKLKADGTISLRPEATASVCRAYIEHGMQQLPQPVKLY